MTPRTSSPRQDPAASRAIDAIIEAPGDWRSTTLARLRAVILSADASIVEEVKWKKPSRPMGVPVWSRDGNICIGEALKSAVRLTFPKGALLTDPKHVFNTRLDSATVRAIDFRGSTGPRSTTSGTSRSMATPAAQPPSGERARSRAQIGQFCAPSAEMPADHQSIQIRRFCAAVSD